MRHYTQLSHWKFWQRRFHAVWRHHITYWLQGKPPDSLIELQGEACLWKADAGSKSKVSLLSEMLNVSKEDPSNPPRSCINPGEKEQAIRVNCVVSFFTLYANVLRGWKCFLRITAGSPSKKPKKPWEEQNEGILKTRT